MLDRVLAWACLPVAVPQALWVRWRASALPPPEGALSGVAGCGPGLRLLIAGDSSALGVGAPDQARALSGNLLRRLAPAYRVTWSVEARSGAATSGLLARLESLPPMRPDVVILCIGVNDAKNGVREFLWRRRLTRLLDLLSGRFGARMICLSGLPPVGQFPALPRPLAWVLSRRFARFDRSMARLAEGRPDCLHVPLAVTIDPGSMAPDGFHAGPALYDLWAELLHEAIAPHLDPPFHLSTNTRSIR